MTYEHFNFKLDMTMMIWLLTLALTLCAAGIDLRSRRIPNWLTVSGFVLGFGIHAVLGRWPGASFSIEGTGLALLVLLPLVLLRGLGAGDWKLMGAVGSFLGPWALLVVLFVSVIVSAVMGVMAMIHAQKVVATLRNIVVLVRGFFVFGWRGNPQITLDNPGLLKLPFGVAAALATLICFVASRWVR